MFEIDAAVDVDVVFRRWLSSDTVGLLTSMRFNALDCARVTGIFIDSMPSNIFDEYCSFNE